MMYAVEIKQTNTNTHLYEFHRNDNGTSEMKVVTNFKPYIYVDEGCKVENFDGVIKTVKGFMSIDGTPVKKVIIQRTPLVYPIREKIEKLGYKHWEADILLHNRYLIDMKNEIKEGPLKVAFFDIETAPADSFKTDKDFTEDIFPDPELAPQVICAISSKIGEEMKTWLCGPNKYEGVNYFEKEKDMLNDFLNYIYRESPDIISAWNLSGFDLPYLINRCKRVGVDSKRLSKTKELYEREFMGKKYYKLFGTVQLDLLDAYKLWRKYGNYPLLQSYSLDFVAKSELNDKKLAHGKPIGWLWKNDLKTLIDYNKQDVELLDKLDKTYKVINFFDSLRRKGRVQFDNVPQTTALVDGFLMSRLKGSIILPTKNRRAGEKYSGAFVFDPKPGLYDNVLCQDIASMYPSIMKNFNISYDSYGKKDIVLPLTPPVSFGKETGIIPRFLDELKDERQAYKTRMLQATSSEEYQVYFQRQFAIKILMNSLYGYLGFPGSRLYKKEVANAITGMGKLIILKIAEWCEERGNKVIYGDTDSVYVLTDKTTPETIAMDGVMLAKHIDENLEKLSKELAPTRQNELHIEFEKILKKVLFTDAKKRYAYKLLWDDSNKFDQSDTLHIQGFDSKRSDSNQVSKIAQAGVISMLLDSKSYAEVMKFLNDLDKKMRNGEFTDEEVGFPKGMTKRLVDYNPPTAVVKGAKFSNDNFKTKFGKGSKPKFVYIKSYKKQHPTIRMRNKDYKLETISYDTQIPPGFEVDWEKMSEKTFKNKLKKIFEAVGWEWTKLGEESLEKWLNIKVTV